MARYALNSFSEAFNLRRTTVLWSNTKKQRTPLRKSTQGARTLGLKAIDSFLKRKRACLSCAINWCRLHLTAHFDLTANDLNTTGRCWPRVQFYRQHYERLATYLNKTWMQTELCWVREKDTYRRQKQPSQMKLGRWYMRRSLHRHRRHKIQYETCSSAIHW